MTNKPQKFAANWGNKLRTHWTMSDHPLSILQNIIPAPPLHPTPTPHLNNLCSWRSIGIDIQY